MNATGEKTRLWLLIFVGVVATLLGQTHAREIFTPSPHESGIFAPQTQASTGENYDGIPYDPLDSLLAAKGGAGNLGKVSDDILEWVGPKSTMSKPPGGSDLILRSSDGTKQIRFDLTNPHGLQPHVNVETFVPRNFFPGDRKMIQTVNGHVFPKP